MFGHYDPLTTAMLGEMDERRARIEAENRLDRAMKLLARFEYGGEGACLECSALAGSAHTDSCAIGNLLNETGRR